MAIKQNSVILLKAEKSGDSIDKYEEILKSNNFEVIQIKTLIFKYKNLDRLREVLMKPDDFSGVFFSSPRCVQAATLALDKETIHRNWHNKLNWVVGEATYMEALQNLEIDCRGKESGNSRNLSKIIVANQPNCGRPILFPHGNLKTDILKMELTQYNLNVEEVHVYDTIPNPEIKQELEEATKNCMEIPEFIIFFSPSGFNSAIEHLKHVLVDLNLVKFIAIGPVTQTAIENAGYKVYSVAKSPNADELLNALHQ